MRIEWKKWSEDKFESRSQPLHWRNTATILMPRVLHWRNNPHVKGTEGTLQSNGHHYDAMIQILQVSAFAHFQYGIYWSNWISWHDFKHEYELCNQTGIIMMPWLKDFGLMRSHSLRETGLAKAHLLINVGITLSDWLWAHGRNLASVSAFIIPIEEIAAP